MMRDVGLPLPTVFDRVRLRVNVMMVGRELRWYAGLIETDFVLFERARDAAPPPRRQSRSLRTGGASRSGILTHAVSISRRSNATRFTAILISLRPTRTTLWGDVRAILAALRERSRGRGHAFRTHLALTGPLCQAIRMDRMKIPNAASRSSQLRGSPRHLSP